MTDLRAFMAAVEIVATDDDATPPKNASEHVVALAASAYRAWCALRRDRAALVRELTDARRKAREATDGALPALSAVPLLPVTRGSRRITSTKEPSRD